MTDINQFIITGTLTEVAINKNGWATIKLETYRQTKDNEEKHLISTVMWGEKVGDLHSGDIVIIQGYLTGREVQKKDGGKFIAESRMATVIKKIGESEKQEQQQTIDDDELPF